MTTTTRNEAAERLRDYLAPTSWDREFEKALAAERHATVERIRAGILQKGGWYSQGPEDGREHPVVPTHAIWDVLDAELAR